jgi:TolB-like protein
MLRSLSVSLSVLLALALPAPVRAADRILVVFPFTVSASTPEISGADISDRIAAEITALGGLTVIKGSKTSKPTEYRTEARDTGADYYYTGSVTGIGSSYSAIEQLVTTRGGTVIWSTTMTFHAVSDIRGEGARIRDEVLRGATPRPGTPPPAAAPSPPPAPAK